MISEFRSDMKDSLERIEQQTTKTNGRVNSLENHRSYLWGAWFAVVFLGGTIIALSIMAIETKIAQGIEIALQEHVERIIYEQ